MRNLANQITGSVTQCVIMLKLDGKFHFKFIKYSMSKNKYSVHFRVSMVTLTPRLFRV